jgi:hypothetical protein
VPQPEAWTGRAARSRPWPWRAGYATTLSSRPSEIVVTRRGPGTIALRHRLDALDHGPAGRRRTSFIVDWRLTRTASGWAATGLSACRG